MKRKVLVLTTGVMLLSLLLGIGIPATTTSAIERTQAETSSTAAHGSITAQPSGFLVPAITGVTTAAAQGTHPTGIGILDNGHRHDSMPLTASDTPDIGLVLAWQYRLQECNDTCSPFGSSPAICDLGLTAHLQVVTGSDEMGPQNPFTGQWMAGAWRAFDDQGNLLWIRDTQSDQARGSPLVVDLNGDGNLEIVGGTTSGRTVQVLNRFGQFVWTFPHPPGTGDMHWFSSPAAADVMPEVSGLQIFIGNRPLNSLFALKGAPNGSDDGISATDIDWPSLGEGVSGWEGVEGEDWDLLWIFEAGGSIVSTPAIGDVTGEGDHVIVFGAGAECGSHDGKVYMLEAATGKLLWSFKTGGNVVESSPALADFDGDGKRDMVVVGSSDGLVYFIEIPESLQSSATFGKGGAGPARVSAFDTGAPVHSSAAVGDVNGDGRLEVIIASTNGKVYSLSYDPTTGAVTQNWAFQTDGPVMSSPALANRGSGRLDVYIGSLDGNLYLLNGVTGEEIARFTTDLPIKTSPAVADIDGDGILEVLLTSGGIPAESPSTTSTATFWCVKDIGSAVSAYAVEWPMFRHNPERTGVYKAIPPIEYDLTIHGSVGGLVITPGHGSFTYPSRSVVNLVAIPERGYRFVRWTGDVLNIADVEAASTSVVMRGDYSITAEFVAVHDLTIGSTAGGSVTMPGEGTFSYDKGTVIDLIAEAEEGYRFFYWTGDVDCVADVDSATTTITVNADCSVTADFRFVGGCLIATAAYGTPTAEDIQVLREFRDGYLLSNPLGQAFVAFYYRASPPVAQFINEHPALKPIVRTALVPAVTLSTVVVNTPPAEKMAIVGSPVPVSVALAVWWARRRSKGPQYS